MNCIVALPILNRCTVLLLAALVAIAASSAEQASAGSLYGWTRLRDGNGQVDFVNIDETTGQATLLFKISIPSGYEARDLTYVPGGKFYGSLFDGGTGRIAEIDPVAMTMTSNLFSGLPRPGIEGMEYLHGTGIVVAGADATGTINALNVVTPAGVVTQTALVPAIVDQDHLAANSSGGNLHVQDVNDPTLGYKINVWTAPFGGSPTLTGVYSGPVSGNEVDVAIHPVTNQFYASEFTRLTYYNLAGPAKVVIGNYNYPGQIWGIAAVPEPGSFSLCVLALAGMLILARRRRKKLG